MTRLKYKYVIGTNVMFYEIDMLPYLVESIIDSVKDIENQENIYIDLLLNTCESFEICESKPRLTEITWKFMKIISLLKEKTNCNIIQTDLPEDTGEPYTMVNYRRDLNYRYANKVDWVIWGETDCLVPHCAFRILDELREAAALDNCYRYITTFADRKMWDASWEPLEHIEFKNLPYYEKSDPRCFTEKHSIRYVMTKDEMDEINKKYESHDEVEVLYHPKFDGSFLCISSDLIKAGANIPLGFWGLSGEDTAFMYECMKVMDKMYVQYVVEYILKAHNREHPEKRKYALSVFDKTESTQEKKGEWYNIVRDMNRENLNKLYDGRSKQSKLNTYQDFLNKMKEHGI